MKKKRKWIERGILLVIFVVAVVIFSFLTNRGDENITAGLDGASYPQVSFEVNGYEINGLSGYVKEMEAAAVRDTVTPVIRGQLKALIKSHDHQITGIDYEVYTPDGSEKLYENTVAEPEERVVFDFPPRELLDDEKLLKMILHVENAEDIYYYTRVIDASMANLKTCLDYAKEFHTNALLKMEDKGIESAIETQPQGNSGGLQHVTINSDFNHVTWGKLEPQVEENIRWNIKELRSTYTCLELEYQAICAGEENEQDKYKVEEFFKIRHSSKANKTYLLEYDREMEQILNPIGQILGSKGVLLGITDEDVSYASNKDGTIVTFVQADELWTYNKEKNDITQIFSFNSEEGYDERNFVRKHEIEILNHGNTGNVRFAVKGYMNRGNHEGEVGIAVYYYDAEEQTVQEEVFVAFDGAMESRVFFNSKINVLYVLTDGNFYEFKLDYRSQDVIAQGLEEGEYKIAPAGDVIAYFEKEENLSDRIIVQNLKKEEVQEVTCGEDEELIPLGFIGTDFVYGVSKKADAGSTITGQSVRAMYKLEILNAGGEIELSYEKPGKYILSAQIEDNMITVSIAEKKDSVYKEETKDYITNNEGEKESKITLESYVTELKEKQRRLNFAAGLDKKEPKIIKANQILGENYLEFAMEKKSATEKYQMYAYGELYGSYTHLGDAIIDAKEHTGVVLDLNQECIWETSNRDLNYFISAENKAIPMILDNLDKGMLPVEAAKAVSDAVCVDLTGCKVEDLLYILNQDIPLIAMTGTKEAVVLVGYNETNVFYKIPGEDGRKSVSFEKMDKMTGKSGNTYIGVK